MAEVASLLPRHRANNTARTSINQDHLVHGVAQPLDALRRDLPSSPFELPSRTRVAEERPASVRGTSDDQYQTNATNGVNTDEGRDSICLCTPAPKIPRPRNAFILYRQHHHAQVAAENPKLANPDISKVIGRSWKNERPEVKDEWKRLAAEEKQRHQRQYPEYRYQPRRSSRTQSGQPGASPTDDQERCSKCNGRLMPTPCTPSTPMEISTFESMADPMSPTDAMSVDKPAPRPSSNEPLVTAASLFANQPRKNRPIDLVEPPFAEVKRRRTDGAGAYHSILPAADYQALYNGNKEVRESTRTVSEGGDQTSFRQYMGPSFLDLGSLPRSHSGSMGPPLRPSPSGIWTERRDPVHQVGFDDSLRLPPLKTAFPDSPATNAATPQRPVMPLTGLGITSPQEHDLKMCGTYWTSQIMELPFKFKLGVLAKVCQPIPPVVLVGLPNRKRGAFIAVEGPDAAMLAEVGNAVEKGLYATSEIALQVWGASQDEACRPKYHDATKPPAASDSIASCLQTVIDWQEKSNQIAHHINNIDTFDTVQNWNMVSEQKFNICQQPGMGPRCGQGIAMAGKIPVALVKQGFSLTFSDEFACNTKVEDKFSPSEHWQWMASLWRGTACPDLIIYAMPSSEEEIAVLGTVEVSKRKGLVIVRIPTGRRLEEGTERRIAFEVMEWIREGSFREQVPQHWRQE